MIYFCDLEMPCTETSVDREAVISLSIVRLDGKVIIDDLIKPRKKLKISSYCTELTGITREDLINKPYFTNVHSKISKLIKANDLTYVWGNEDAKVYSNCCARYQLPMNINIVDYQKIIKVMCKLKYDMGLNNASISLGTPERPCHNSLEDTLKLRDIYMYIESNKEDVKYTLRKAEYLHLLIRLNEQYKEVI